MIRDAERAQERIVATAAALLDDGGPDAVSTRAVSIAAGVQAPTLYRLFGDKRGLLDAVAAHALTTYVAEKAGRVPGPDPVEDLRAGWDLHVAFGLAHPAAYVLAYGAPDPARPAPPAVAAGRRILAEHVHRIAAAGRLRVGEEAAARLIHAAGSGTTLALLAEPADRRDPGLSALAREAVLAAVTTDPPPAADPGPVTAAVTLRAALPRANALTPAERGLMGEWLDRIARPDRGRPPVDDPDAPTPGSGG